MQIFHLNETQITSQNILVLVPTWRISPPAPPPAPPPPRPPSGSACSPLQAASLAWSWDDQHWHLTGKVIFENIFFFGGGGLLVFIYKDQLVFALMWYDNSLFLPSIHFVVLVKTNCDLGHYSFWNWHTAILADLNAPWRNPKIGNNFVAASRQPVGHWPPGCRFRYLAPRSTPSL